MRKPFCIPFIIILLLLCVSSTITAQNIVNPHKVVLDIGNDKPYRLDNYYAVYDGKNIVLFYSLREHLFEYTDILMMRKLGIHGRLIWEKKLKVPAASSVIQAGWDGTNYFVVLHESEQFGGHWSDARLHVLQVDPTGDLRNSSSLEINPFETILYIVGSSEKIRIFTKVAGYPYEWNAINLYQIDFENGIKKSRSLPVNKHSESSAYSFCLVPEGLLLIALDAVKRDNYILSHHVRWETKGFDSYIMNFNGSILSRKLYEIPINNVIKSSLNKDTKIHYIYWHPSGVYCELESNKQYWDDEGYAFENYSINISLNGVVSQNTSSDWRGKYVTQALNGGWDFVMRTVSWQTSLFTYNWKHYLFQTDVYGESTRRDELPHYLSSQDQLLSIGRNLSLFHKSNDSIYLIPINVLANIKSHIVYAKAGTNDMFRRTRHVMWNVANVQNVKLILPDGSKQIHPPIGYTLIRHKNKRQKVILRATGTDGEKIKRTIWVKP